MTTATGAASDERRDTGVWMHAVVAADVDPGNLTGMVGVAGTPVRTVAAAGIAAAVSDVPLAEYGEPALHRNLEDLHWLERVARTHHAVVEGLSQIGAVVPARLATIYHDDDRVARVLTERRDELFAVLDRLAGREEWGIKAYAVADVAPSDVSDDRTGTAYLLRRKAQLAAQRQGQQAAAEAAAAVHAALADYAVAARRHPPQDRRLSGADTAMALNGAYLVDREDLPSFATLVSDLAQHNPAIRLELTGPWPPYSFVDEAPPVGVPRREGTA
jgi:hypothetical protein